MIETLRRNIFTEFSILYVNLKKDAPESEDDNSEIELDEEKEEKSDEKKKNPSPNLGGVDDILDIADEVSDFIPKQDNFNHGCCDNNDNGKCNCADCCHGDCNGNDACDCIDCCHGDCNGNGLCDCVECCCDGNGNGACDCLECCCNCDNCDCS